MKTYDITETMQRHYPALKDLLTEDQFHQHLLDEGIKVASSSLRDYRHRDKKFAYVRKGQQVFYPLHVNKQIIKELKHVGHIE